MDDIFVKFGSIFKYNEKDYIYLIHTEKILYSALVVDAETSKLLKYRAEYILKSRGTPQAGKLLEQKIYCFVELRTEEVKERLALFTKTGEEPPLESCLPIVPIGELNKEDLIEIKKLIGNSTAIPIELKEKVENIVIES